MLAPPASAARPSSAARRRPARQALGVSRSRSWQLARPGVLAAAQRLGPHAPAVALAARWPLAAQRYPDARPPLAVAPRRDVIAPAPDAALCQAPAALRPLSGAAAPWDQPASRPPRLALPLVEQSGPALAAPPFARPMPAPGQPAPPRHHCRAPGHIRPGEQPYERQSRADVRHALATTSGQVHTKGLRCDTPPLNIGGPRMRQLRKAPLNRRAKMRRPARKPFSVALVRPPV